MSGRSYHGNFAIHQHVKRNPMTNAPKELYRMSRGSFWPEGSLKAWSSDHITQVQVQPDNTIHGDMLSARATPLCECRTFPTR